MFDLDIEQSLLGTLLHNPTLIDEHRLTDEIFHHPTCKKIYLAIRDLHITGETVDVLSVANKLPKHKLDVAKCNSAYISDHYAKKHIKILNNLSYRRRLDNVADLIKDIAEADEIDESALDEAQRILLSEHSPKRSKTIFEAVNETMIMAEAIEAGERSGLITDVWAVDNGIGGLHGSDLIILAARPSVGKTALAAQIGAEVAKIGHVDLFSLEMSAQQLAQRILCTQAKVSGHRLRTGILSPQEWERLAAAEPQFAELDMTIHDEPIQNILDIRSACRRSENLKLIIVDYLQLMTSVDSYQGSRNNQVSEISRSLKALAKEFNVPVLALSQLSRTTEKDNRKPRLSDLRDSGAIEQDADIVCFLHREKNQEKKEFTNTAITELIVAKHRHGPTGTKNMMFDDNLATFKDIGR